MTEPDAVVIVGAGLAGASAAETLREQGFSGSLTLVGTEAEPPYERPPLSKDYLLGKAERSAVYVHPRQWYDDQNIDLRLGTTVSRIDRSTHRLSLDDGTQLPYDKLLLTTGSTPRLLEIQGAGLDGIHYLRRLQDSDALKQVLHRADRIAVIGAGWIGLEVAAAARAAGVRTTVVDTAPLPLLRVLGPEVAQVFADLHRDNGVDLRLGSNLGEITGHGGHVDAVLLADGTRIDADAVIVGVGITPNTELAILADLDVSNGILVDDRLQTSDADIHAAGDVANAFHPLLQTHVRVEHWANALHQPRTAALAMLGQDVHYDRIPYFYTDQYDLGMEYAGYVEPGGYDDVVFRGDVAGREFLAFWLSGGRVAAGMNVNIWDVNDDIQELIRAGVTVNREELADPARPLQSLLSR